SAATVDPQKEGDLPTVLPKVYADLQPIVDKLRGEAKVDVVVALSHAGDPDTSTDEAAKGGEDYQIAANVTGIDLIVSGHAHNADPKPLVVTNAKGGSTLVLNAGAFGKQLGRVELTVHADGRPLDWNKATQALLPVDDATAPDPAQAAASGALVAAIEKAS